MRAWTAIVLGLLACIVAGVILGNGAVRLPRLPTVPSTNPGPCTPRAHHLTPARFGAVGDGRRDDAAALQRAIDTASATHVPLLLGCRTYRVDSALSLPSGAVVEGYGARSVLHFTWRNQLGSASHGSAFIEAVRAHGVALASFVLEGPTNGLPSGPTLLYPLGLASGVRFIRVVGFSIRGMEIRNTPSIGINYQNSTDGVVADNYVHNTGRDGITGIYADATGLTDILVIHNRVVRSGDDAIAIIGAGRADFTPGIGRPRGFVVSGNTIIGWARDPNGSLLGRGIVVSSAVQVVIMGNSIDTTPGDGILVMNDPIHHPLGTGVLANSSDVTIVGNSVSNAGRAGGIHFHDPTDRRAAIQVLGADHVSIANNRLGRSAGPAVIVERCEVCTVQ